MRTKHFHGTALPHNLQILYGNEAIDARCFMRYWLMITRPDKPRQSVANFLYHLYRSLMSCEVFHECSLALVLYGITIWTCVEVLHALWWVWCFELMCSRAIVPVRPLNWRKSWWRRNGQWQWMTTVQPAGRTTETNLKNNRVARRSDKIAQKGPSRLWRPPAFNLLFIANYNECILQLTNRPVTFSPCLICDFPIK